MRAVVYKALPGPFAYLTSSNSFKIECKFFAFNKSSLFTVILNTDGSHFD